MILASTSLHTRSTLHVQEVWFQIFQRYWTFRGFIKTHVSSKQQALAERAATVPVTPTPVLHFIHVRGTSLSEARICFTDPNKHSIYVPVYAAIVVPANVPKHICCVFIGTRLCAENGATTCISSTGSCGPSPQVCQRWPPPSGECSGKTSSSEVFPLFPVDFAYSFCLFNVSNYSHCWEQMKKVLEEFSLFCFAWTAMRLHGSDFWSRTSPMMLIVGCSRRSFLSLASADLLLCLQKCPVLASHQDCSPTVVITSTKSAHTWCK